MLSINYAFDDRLKLQVRYLASLKPGLIECQGATLRHLDSPDVAQYWSVMTTFYVGMRNRKIAQRNAIQKKLGASA